jgi:hypothetical protein
MDLGEQAGQFTILIRDRAGQFTGTFDTVLTDAGITVCKIPPQCLRANAHAERFVLTARTEVTDRMLVFNERHLRRTLGEYARHYNGRRPHRALQLQPPRSDRPAVDLGRERIKRRPVLGGLINEAGHGDRTYSGSQACSPVGDHTHVSHVLRAAALRWRRGWWSNAGSRTWRWNPPGRTGDRCTRHYARPAGRT